MLEVTIESAIAALFCGVLGGLANVAYSYLKLNEPIEVKKTIARTIIGAVAGVLFVHAALSDPIDWYEVMLLGITGGYFGVDVIELFIKPPVKKSKPAVIVETK